MDLIPSARFRPRAVHIMTKPVSARAELHTPAIIHAAHGPALCRSSWPTPPTAAAWRRLSWLMSWRQPWPLFPSTAGLLPAQAAPQRPTPSPPSLRAPERCPAPGPGTFRKLQVTVRLLASCG